MAGSGFVLTDRDRQLATEVLRFGALTREQAMRLGYFTSATRAKARLKILTDQGVLTTRPHAVSQRGVRHVYLPGRELLGGSARARMRHTSPLFLAHQLGLVDIRIAFERHTSLERWWTEKELVAASLGFIPDGYIEYRIGAQAFSAFVEYDRGTETLTRIQHKVRAYAQLAFTGTFEQRFGRKYFRLLLVTDTPGRLATLSKASAAVTDKVVRLTTLHDLTTRGPQQSIWIRPGVPVPESLTGS